MKIIRQKLFALPTSNLVQKIVGKGTALTKPSMATVMAKHPSMAAKVAAKNPMATLKAKYPSMEPASDKYIINRFRHSHMTDREKLIDRAAGLVRDKSIRKSFFGKNPTKENMDYVMSRIRLPYSTSWLKATKVNPYFNGKFNQLNNFSK